MEPLLNEQTATPGQHEVTRALAETHEFIDRGGLFHSEIDRAIAHDIADRIGHNGWLLPETQLPALDALTVLVPVSDGKGRRLIDSTIVTPQLERRIESRLSSPEVNIAGSEGSWGRLPDIVKRQMMQYGSHISLEMAANCTVGCNFCVYADKGPISAKASFDSIVEVIEYYDKHQVTSTDIPRRDVLYWGTDPFDIKWVAGDGFPERDYRDIARAHAAITGFNRNLDTSTAVPIGEEMRVLQFAIDLLDGERNIDPKFQKSMRLSITHANAARVGHMRTILNALHPNAPNLLINDTRNHVAIRGKRLEHPSHISSWDVTGPACMDGVVIGLTSVDRIIMQGASNERPNGELRLPIESQIDGGTRYTIPRFQRAPFLDGLDNPSNMFLPMVADIIDVNDTLHSVTTETYADDPHRALIRLAGAMIHYTRKHGTGLPMDDAERAAIEQEFAPAAQRLRTYLAQNPGNWVMQSILEAGMHPLFPKKIGKYAINN